MRKTSLVFTTLILFSFLSSAQLRVALVGGAHQSNVLEENSLPGWDKKNYPARTGAHFGFIADLPFSSKKNFSFQPGVIFYNKGRKYEQDFDTNFSTFRRSTGVQYVNYIDVPFNLVLKFGKKTKFIVGGGPYASFFYNGREKRESVLTNGSGVVTTETTDLPVGDKPGGYKILDYGVNGLAGLEFGRVFITANYSRGLNDFYQAVSYDGSFKHQVIGGTLGIFLGKPVDAEKQPKDKDKDGITDDKDDCPSQAGSELTKGCPDKDGDGIADKNDKCPDQPGLLKNNGCPEAGDKDKDGVADASDKCPDQFGLARYNGCPVPDTDKDGINDEEDKCPAVAGYARYAGCPVPDKDGDGVNDEEDKCPDVKGTKDNNGCPAIKKEIIEKVNYAARRIQFAYTKATLVGSSYKVLDEVAKILNDNPELNLSVEGHTSNAGVPEMNMKLSQKRADNTKAYLVLKGINSKRLTAKGFGQTKPLNNGSTEAEKAKNRRVELKLSN